MAGPTTKKTACSRTITISAQTAPSPIRPPSDHVSRTRNQTATNSAAANALQAWLKPGAMYM